MIENFKQIAKSILEQKYTRDLIFSEKQSEKTLLLLDNLLPEYEKNCLIEYSTDG